MTAELPVAVVYDILRSVDQKNRFSCARVNATWREAANLPELVADLTVHLDGRRHSRQKVLHLLCSFREWCGRHGRGKVARLAVHVDAPWLYRGLGEERAVKGEIRGQLGAALTELGGGLRRLTLLICGLHWELQPEVGRQLGGLTRLEVAGEVLEPEAARMMELTGSLQHLAALRELRLGADALPGVWDSMPRSLTRLHLHGAPRDAYGAPASFPSQLGLLTGLRSLELTWRAEEGRSPIFDWTYAPLASLTRLESLALTGANLYCPVCLTRLTRLTSLQIEREPVQAQRSWHNLARALPHMARLRQLETPLAPQVAAALPGSLQALLCREPGPGSTLPAGLQLERLVVSAATLLASMARMATAPLRHVGIFQLQGPQHLQPIVDWAAQQAALRSLRLLPCRRDLACDFDAAAALLQQRNPNVRLERWDGCLSLLWHAVLAEPM